MELSGIKKSDPELHKVHQFCNIGSWEYDLLSSRFILSDDAYGIYEIDKKVLPEELNDILNKICHPEDKSGLEYIIENANEKSKTYLTEYRIILENNNIKYLSFIGEPVFDNVDKILGYRGTVQDVTARKESEEKQQLRMLFLESVVNSSFDGILVVNGYGQKILQNQRTIDLWKIPKNIVEDIDGKHQVQHVMQMAKDPKQFVDEIDYLREHPYENSIDELELIDGTFLDRYSAPVIGRENKNYGRVWTFHDVTERKIIERKVRALLQGKEIVLKEVHHRIKNNMNIIASLLTHEASLPKSIDAKDILLSASGQIQSMMVLYDKLYLSENQNEVGAKNYFTSLIDNIISIFHNDLTLDVITNIDDFIIDSSILSSLGIMINELITNSMKYAFTNRSQGLIKISVTKVDNQVTIVYEDDGVGLPEDINLEESSGFGLQLINMLTKQIGGTISIERQYGTRFIIIFLIQDETL